MGMRSERFVFRAAGENAFEAKNVGGIRKRKPGMEVWKRIMGKSWSANLENHARETAMMKSVIEEFR